MSIGVVSIKDACDKVGMPPEKKTFAEFWPVSASNDQVFRLARKKDASCCYIRLSTDEES